MDGQLVPVDLDSPAAVEDDPTVEIVEIGEFQQRIAQVFRAELEQTEIEALLPPAQELKAYDDAVENGAERAMRVYEAETSHRADTDRIATEGALEQNRRGQEIAKQLAIIAFVCAVVFGAWGGAIGSTGLLVLAGVFLAMPVALIIKAFLGK